MNEDKLAHRMQDVHSRVAELEAYSGESAPWQQELLLTTFENLRAALEELHAAEEELLQQNEELATAHQALEAERSRYHDLFEFAPDGYLVTNVRGVIEEANHAAAMLLNIAQPFLIGKPLVLFVAEEESRAFRRELSRMRQENRTQEWEVRLHPHGGTRIDVALMVTAIHDREGKPITLRWLLRDISERKRAEEQRLTFERKLLEAQRLESMGVLAGGIAHDFNNLLGIILGDAELALLEIPPENPARGDIEQIVSSARRAADLTRQMLAYAGKARFVVQALDLNDLILEIGALLQASIAKHVTLRYQLAPRLPAIEADSSQIHQVVMNLILNAAEAIGDQNGSITITSVVRHVDHAYLSNTYLAPDVAEGEYVALEVSDTGQGMDAETLSKIFDPFFTTKFTGRGLGLSAVIGIVRSHHGMLKVESAPRRGTTFAVLFPCLPAPVKTFPSAPMTRALWRGSGTVLVIDDEEGLRLVAAHMLELLGFKVLLAPDGVVGLELLRDHADMITCVLLDMTMPRMSAKQTFQAIRHIKPDVPVVLMSGYDEQEAIGRFAGIGLAGFLQKPFTSNDLRAKMQLVLTNLFIVS